MNLGNQKGFALPLILALLPVLIAGVLLISVHTGMIQADLAMKYQCRAQGKSGQSLVAPLLESLLALNPKAQRLRQEQLQNLRDIAAATASKNPAALALATRRYLAVRRKQTELDGRQKQLIRQSNRILAENHFSTSAKIRTEALKASNPLLKLHFQSLNGRAPRLAVQPDLPDLAPIYNLASDFAEAQALAHQWNYRLEVRAPFSRFLPGTFDFKKACAVSLRKEHLKWSPQIIEGKYSSKSVW